MSSFALDNATQAALASKKCQLPSDRKPATLALGTRNASRSRLLKSNAIQALWTQDALSQHHLSRTASQDPTTLVAPGLQLSSQFATKAALILDALNLHLQLLSTASQAARILGVLDQPYLFRLLQLASLALRTPGARNLQDQLP